MVGWVARLIPVKACDVFLRALADCRGLPLKAAIVGDGPERAALETLTAELGLQHQVKFCGARQQAGQFFSAFDAFVLSSKSEGTPMTLLEAMAAGVPIVTTEVGGIPDVVTATEALLGASGGSRRPRSRHSAVRRGPCRSSNPGRSGNREARERLRRREVAGEPRGPLPETSPLGELRPRSRRTRWWQGGSDTNTREPGRQSSQVLLL